MGVPKTTAVPRADALRGEFHTRTHFIHCVLILAEGPLKPAEIGRRAALIARLSGYDVKETTFSGKTTGSHLQSMRNKTGRGFAEPTGDGRWQLSRKAWEQLGVNPPGE